MYNVELPDGTLVQVPDNVPEDEARRRIRKQFPQFASKERTTGEAFKDVGASVLGGIGSVLQVPGQLTQLVPGLYGVGSALAKPGAALSELASGLKSQGLQVREALRSKAISEADKEGVLSGFATAIGQTIKDPALLSTFLAEQLPQLIGPAAAVKVARLATASKVAAAGEGLAGIAAKDAIEAAAKSANVTANRAAMGTGAAMQGADVSSDTFNEAMAHLAQTNPNMPEEQRRDIALNAARKAGAIGLAASGLSMALPGAQAIEKRLAGIPGVGRIKSALGESGQEIIEEGGGQFGKNVAMQPIDPTRELLQGVGSAAGLGAIGGGILGGAFGNAAPPPELMEGQQAGETARQSAERLQQEINDLQGLKAIQAQQDAEALQTGLGPAMTAKMPQPGETPLRPPPRRSSEEPAFNNLLATTPEEQAGPAGIANMLAAAANQGASPSSTQSRAAVDSLMVPTDRAAPTPAPIGIQALLGGNDPTGASRPAVESSPEFNELMTQSADPYAAPVGLNVALGGIANTLPSRSVPEGTPTFNQLMAQDKAIETGIAAATRAAAGKPSTSNEQGPATPILKQPEPTFVSGLNTIIKGGKGSPSQETAQGPASPIIPVVPPATPEAGVQGIIKAAKGQASGQQNTAPASPVMPQKPPESGVSGVIKAAAGKPSTAQGPLGQPLLPKIQEAGLASATKGGRGTPTKTTSPSNVNNLNVPEATDEAIQQEPAPEGNADVGTAGGTSVPVVGGQGVESTAAGVGKPEGGGVGVPKPDVGGAAGRKAKPSSALKKSLAATATETEPTPEVGDEAVDKQIALKKKQLQAIMLRIMSGMGLRDVGLKLVDNMDAEGEYANQLITLALNVDSPVRVLRHESIHAMKAMGLFSPQQWETLRKEADTKWIKQFLGEGKDSRQEAYQKLFIEDQGLSEADAKEAMIEEAIADAFGQFDLQGAPSGLMSAILKRMQNMFAAIKSAFGGTETAEQILQRAEKGKLQGKAVPVEGAAKPSLRGKYRIDKTETEDYRTGLPKAAWNVVDAEDGYVYDTFDRKRDASDWVANAESKEQPKASLRSDVQFSTVPIMQAPLREAQEGLRLKTERVRGRYNVVREVAIALNKQTTDAYGKMNRQALTEQNQRSIAEAIADEVAYQLSTTSTTGTGLGWYSNNYPKAVKLLASKFPELGNNRHARSVFSALVAVTSNGERVNQNIANAIKLYAKLRDGKPLVAMGNRRPTALQNNLIAIQKLLQEQGTNFESFLLREMTVSDMNVELRKKGDKPDADYLAETIVPAAAVYFGPKLGAFYANLSGSEGYLTMDLWWTRTINRMRGLLLPSATESSLNNFREMVGELEMSKDDILEEVTPFRNKYKEHDYQTDLEFLTKSKEPTHKVDKPEWFAKAERLAGPAYDQLLYEHRLEKISNTIYKNELEMLEEAPFTATDRAFMYDVARMAQRILADRGMELSLADVQASLWYYEKRLYAKLTGNRSDDIGYEEAIIQQSKAGGGRARPSVVFTQQPDSGAQPGGTVQQTERPSQEGDGQKLSEVRPSELAVRPSTGGGEALGGSGAKASLRGQLRSYRGSNAAIPESHQRRGFEDGTSVRVLGATPIAQYTPADTFKGLVGEYGFKSPVFYELSGDDADVYERAIQEAKNNSPYGAAVYVYPLDQYQKMRLFLTEDGKSGIALKGDDIVSVFSGPPHKGSANSSLQLAIQEGGRRLDAYDTVLTGIYHANGFNVVGRMKWNEDYKPDDWSKQAFESFNNGEPDVVYMAYDPEDTRTVIENPGEYFIDPDELANAQAEAVRKQAGAAQNVPSQPSIRQGIVLGEKQPLAQSFNGVHYGKEQVDVLTGAKYGTGLRGAERKRLDNSYDARIKRRAYFYVAKDDGSMSPPESGLGSHVYTQKFDNILGPGKEMSRLFSEARGDSNDFESVVIDAGYDGYAVPNMGMMVVLNHDVPVQYEGTRAEVDKKGGVKFSIRAPNTKEFKQWFGKSTIVDAEGNPKVMYHGTARDITSFRAKQANAIFITEEPTLAENYAYASADWMAKNEADFFTPAEKAAARRQVIESLQDQNKSLPKSSKDFNKQVIAYLKTGDEDAASDVKDYAKEALLDVYVGEVPRGANILPVFVKAENPFDYDNAEHIAKLEKYAKDRLYTSDSIENYIGFIKNGSWEEIESNKVQKAIRSLGFDGFYVKEGGVKNLAVYNPEQIKSATGNQGTFDINNPDIRKSLRTKGDPTTKANVLAAMNLAHEQNHYMNCQLAVQMATGVTKLRELPTVKSAQVGDVYTFNETKTMASHYAIDLGDGNVSEIEGWGDAPREVPLADLVSEYDEPSAIRRPPETAYTAQALSAKASLRSTLPAALVQRVDQTTVAREDKGFISRILKAISPGDHTSIRAELLNRYNQLSVIDKMRIKKMGGAAAMADISAESAALLSDLRAGIVASALGVHDKVGGAPVYVQSFYIVRNGQILPRRYKTRALAQASAGPGGEVRSGGHTSVVNFNGDVKGPLAIFAPLAAINDPMIYQLYQFWAAAKRGKRLTKEGREELLTPADQAHAQFLEKKYPMFVQVQKDFIKYNNKLVDYMVDTGVLSPERGKIYTEHADYLPFYRQIEGLPTAGPKIFASISGVKPPKALKGSDARLDDFLETIVRNTQAAVEAGVKNVAAQRAVEAAKDVNLAVKIPQGNGMPTTVVVHENGVPTYYACGDVAFVNAMKSLGMSDIPFLSILSMPANLLRAAVTKEPTFMLANMLRDSMSAYVTSGVSMTPVIDTAKNFAMSMAGKSPEYDALRKAGILGGYEFSQGVETSGRKLGEKLKKANVKSTGFKRAGELAASPFTGVWQLLEKGSEASDAATRIEIYKRTLAETGNETEALFKSLEVMNFNRKGRAASVRILTAVVPFLNARMQGLDVLYRAAIQPSMPGQSATAREKELQHKFLVRGATMAALSCLYWALTHDDDEYKKQEQDTKDNYWLFPSMGIKIPIPFEIGVLFKVIPERIMALAFGDDSFQDFRESMTNQIVSTLHFNPIPQAVIPIVENITNHSFFTGRAIVSQGMEGIEAGYQVGPNTSSIMADLGKATGISPIKLEAAVQGYTGQMGMYLVSAIDAMYEANSTVERPAKRFEQLPLIKRFAIDPEARGTVTSFYQLKDKVDAAVKTANMMERGDPDVYDKYIEANQNLLASKDYINALASDMKDLAQMKVMIRSSDDSAEVKKEALLEIQQLENDMTSNIKDLKREFTP